MATTNQSMWCDHHWHNISTQLLHAFHIDASNFKDGLLKKETQNGQWLHAWLVRAFHEYSTTARETAMIRVTPPDHTSNNIYSLMLDITVRRHGATVVASFPAPFDASTPAAATSVASTSAASTSAVSTSAAPTTAVPTTTETATAGLSSTTPNADDVPGPSSSSAGNKGL